MEINMYEKPVTTRFVSVNGVEFKFGVLLCCLEEIRTTEVDDHYGDHSLRDYELSHPNEMNKLVKIGLVKNYTGSRMANLYCMQDKEEIEKLVNVLYDLDEKFEKEKSNEYRK